MTNVLIVEDDPMARTLLEIFVKGSGRYRMAGSLESAATAELFCMRNPVDLILMDVCTALGASGLEAAARIKRDLPEIKIIIVTSQPECDFIARARRAGVDSFWYKESSVEAVLSVMDRTMAGESVYPDAAPQMRLGSALSGEFTAMELQVLRELTSGDTDEEIAQRLHLSPWTVRKYVRTMLEKTDFKSRTQLAIAARECGVVIRGY